MTASVKSSVKVRHQDYRLEGTMVLPGDDRFDQARLAWNLAVDQRPAAVAFPESAADVAAAIGWAAERGSTRSTQDGVH